MKFRLIVEVEYTGSATKKAKAEVRETLHAAATFLAGNGLLSEGTGREVESWTHQVEEVPGDA